MKSRKAMSWPRLRRTRPLWTWKPTSLARLKRSWYRGVKPSPLARQWQSLAVAQEPKMQGQNQPSSPLKNRRPHLLLPGQLPKRHLPPRNQPLKVRTGPRQRRVRTSSKRFLRQRREVTARRSKCHHWHAGWLKSITSICTSCRVRDPVAALCATISRIILSSGALPLPLRRPRLHPQLLRRRLPRLHKRQRPQLSQKRALPRRMQKSSNSHACRCLLRAA